MPPRQPSPWPAPSAGRRFVSTSRTSGRYGTGSFAGTLEEFQRAEGATVRPLKAARSWRSAGQRRWSFPARTSPRSRAQLGSRRRACIGVDEPGSPPTPVVPGGYTSRTPSSSSAGSRRRNDLGVAIEAIARVPAARLVIVGDGPNVTRSSVHALVGRRRQGPVRGSRTRDDALRTVAVAALLSSAWGEPLMPAVEALSVGAPVVATVIGGVPEVV